MIKVHNICLFFARDYIFRIFKYFVAKLCSLTNFKTLFVAIWWWLFRISGLEQVLAQSWNRLRLSTFSFSLRKWRTNFYEFSNKRYCATWYGSQVVVPCDWSNEGQVLVGKKWQSHWKVKKISSQAISISEDKERR